MFTGIVETMGTVKSAVPMDSSESGGGGCSIVIGDASIVLTDVHIGDSIAVSGVCLTVTEFDDARSWFKVGIAPETLRKTNLGELKEGMKVNLERAMSASTRFGGHFVQGHVDTTVIVKSITPDPPNSLIIRFQVPSPVDGHDTDYLRYIVPKGYVTLEGTSLTVIDVDVKERTFTVMLIPHTQQHVTLPTKKVGQKVNLEVDQIGKYVENVAVSVLSGHGNGNDALVGIIRNIVDARVKELLDAKK
ncbi:hypothetical protein DFS34DRAFT_26091 [Phlyctochytrium arcticum]|nr:hypothetical protein DFS34DRAFT_26091 [Phlyctochytrium arcticum]